MRALSQERLFRNFYRCARCGQEWTDVWSAQCDDDCPHCGARHMSPYDSEDVEEGLERRAFRDDTLLDEPPQGDRQFASQSDDANLPASHPHIPESLVPPTGAFAVRLIAKPEPSELDKRLARELRPRFVTNRTAPRGMCVSKLLALDILRTSYSTRFAKPSETVPGNLVLGKLSWAKDRTSVLSGPVWLALLDSTL